MATEERKQRQANHKKKRATGGAESKRAREEKLRNAGVPKSVVDERRAAQTTADAISIEDFVSGDRAELSVAPRPLKSPLPESPQGVLGFGGLGGDVPRTNETGTGFIVGPEGRRIDLVPAPAQTSQAVQVAATVAGSTRDVLGDTARELPDGGFEVGAPVTPTGELSLDDSRKSLLGSGIQGIRQNLETLSPIQQDAARQGQFLGQFDPTEPTAGERARATTNRAIRDFILPLPGTGTVQGLGRGLAGLAGGVGQALTGTLDIAREQLENLGATSAEEVAAFRFQRENQPRLQTLERRSTARTELQGIRDTFAQEQEAARDFAGTGATADFERQPGEGPVTAVALSARSAEGAALASRERAKSGSVNSFTTALVKNAAATRENKFQQLEAGRQIKQAQKEKSRIANPLGERSPFFIETMAALERTAEARRGGKRGQSKSAKDKAAGFITGNEIEVLGKMKQANAQLRQLIRAGQSSLRQLRQESRFLEEQKIELEDSRDVEESFVQTRVDEQLRKNAASRQEKADTQADEIKKENEANKARRIAELDKLRKAIADANSGNKQLRDSAFVRASKKFFTRNKKLFKFDEGDLPEGLELLEAVKGIPEFQRFLTPTSDLELRAESENIRAGRERQALGGLTRERIQRNIENVVVPSRGGR